MNFGPQASSTSAGGAATTLLCALALAACVEEPPAPEVWSWDLPEGFPTPEVPADNPMSAAKVELGRHLFYDPRLSGDGTIACATCHQQARAFTNGEAAATGSAGQRTPRSPMSLANVAYASTLSWGNPLLVDLETQALIPLFGEDPAEMGGAGRWDEIEARLVADPLYARAFAAAFPGDPEPISLLNVTRALACFERALISSRSPLDRHRAGDEGALGAAARRGMALFESPEVGCAACHGGVLFTDAVAGEGEAPFHRVGLAEAAYLPPNRGVAEISGRPEDEGRFKAPTLRNIALTAPYMHDGSIATLEEVVEHFAAGGAGEAGQPALAGFELTDGQRADLLAFLRSLTDEDFVTDARFSNPWIEGQIAEPAGSKIPGWRMTP